MKKNFDELVEILNLIKKYKFAGFSVPEQLITRLLVEILKELRKKWEANFFFTGWELTI